MASWKDPVRVATTGANILLNGTQIIDGIGVAVGDRVLVKDQANASENGIYVVASGQWARASDANTDALMEPQMMVRVSEGALNGSDAAIVGGTAWLLANSAPITLGSTTLYFVLSDLLKQDRFGQFWRFQGSAIADGDIFVIANSLQDGQSNNPQAYLAASLAGYGGICTGVHGRNGAGSSVPPALGSGVYGDSDNGFGVFGSSAAADAVHGESQNGVGVYGGSVTADAIQGRSQSSQHAGVSGANSGGGFGVWGNSDAVVGVYGGSVTADAIQGRSQSSQHAGVSGANSGGGFGVWASSNSTGLYAQGIPAGYFNGDVLVTGDLVLVNQSGDVAEDFDVEANALNLDPGTVLIINEKGNMCASEAPYDTRVAGVAAGAGNLKPAVLLQRVPSQKPRLPIALVGKAICKVDATFGEIIAGDLLTTSGTPGHAMKAADRSRAVGAIIGKALASLDAGIGLIPILVSSR
jgi:hypothetical protein